MDGLMPTYPAAVDVYRPPFNAPVAGSTRSVACGSYDCRSKTTAAALVFLVLGIALISVNVSRSLVALLFGVTLLVGATLTAFVMYAADNEPDEPEPGRGRHRIRPGCLRPTPADPDPDYQPRHLTDRPRLNAITTTPAQPAR